MKRKIIRIDEDKCTGCGDCIPNCPEGAIQIIDGKARLVADSLCDGLGACLGHCPEGAMTVEDAEAADYDERQVIKNVVRQGPAVVQAHLKHLEEHGEHENLRIAREVLQSHHHGPAHGGACPGSRSMAFGQKPAEAGAGPSGARPSALAHWPVQLHLVSPRAEYFRKADLLLAADCVAYAVGDFHKDFLSGKKLAIACPKLDDGTDHYVEKLAQFIDEAQINTLTVMTMEVPCCGGLLQMARQAVSQAVRKVPVKHIQVSLQGEILNEQWI